MTLTKIIKTLELYFNNLGGTLVESELCLPMGAATFHPTGSFFPIHTEEEPFKHFHQVCLRPLDSNSRCMYSVPAFFQYNVLMPVYSDTKPIVLSLEVLGHLGFIDEYYNIDVIKSSWESTSLKAKGKGYEILINGVEVVQITYLEKVGLAPKSPLVEICFGADRLNALACGISVDESIKKCNQKDPNNLLEIERDFVINRFMTSFLKYSSRELESLLKCEFTHDRRSAYTFSYESHCFASHIVNLLASRDRGYENREKHMLALEENAFIMAKQKANLLSPFMPAPIFDNSEEIPKRYTEREYVMLNINYKLNSYVREDLASEACGIVTYMLRENGLNVEVRIINKACFIFASIPSNFMLTNVQISFFSNICNKLDVFFTTLGCAIVDLDNLIRKNNNLNLDLSKKSVLVARERFYECSDIVVFDIAKLLSINYMLSLKDIGLENVGRAIGSDILKVMVLEKSNKILGLCEDTAKRYKRSLTSKLARFIIEAPLERTFETPNVRDRLHSDYGYFMQYGLFQSLNSLSTGADDNDRRDEVIDLKTQILIKIGRFTYPSYRKILSNLLTAMPAWEVIGSIKYIVNSLAFIVGICKRVRGKLGIEFCKNNRLVIGNLKVFLRNRKEVALKVNTILESGRLNDKNERFVREFASDSFWILDELNLSRCIDDIYRLAKVRPRK